MKLLTRSDIQQSISMREAVEVVKLAFGELSTGRADIPLRTALSLPKHDGVTLFMPGYLSDSESFAVKIVSVHNRNPERNLPLINAVVVVIDTATGRASAAIAGGYLTALRTGAGTDLPSRKDAEVAAIIGAGAQARTQALAVAAVRPIKRFWVYARRRDRVEEMIEELRPQLEPSIEMLGADSPTQAVREAHVI